jgi:uncharacterized membrane protein YhaH (DUF805 family)
VAIAWAACDDGAMNRVVSDQPSPKISGRLAREPFALAVIVIYLVSFLSQALLSAPVTARFNVVPFVLAQTVLIAIWIVLHRRRLNDAGRPSGIVFGVAAVYALEVVLLSILVGLMLTIGTSDGVGPQASILNFFVLLYFLSLMSGDPTLGAMQVWLWGFVVLLLLPVAIALGLSLWAATRPSSLSQSMPAVP